MATPEQERARIAGVYSGMSDEELRRVALDRAELTSIAQEALTAEIARRNLDLTSPEIDNSPEPNEPEPSPPHSDEEYKRIAGVYSAKSDEELARLAATGFELSDEGHQALEAEITRRGLNLTLAPHPGFDVCELNDLVTLRKFRDLPEALMAKGSLESAGIESHLADDNMIRMNWFISNLLGGVKLQVHPEDVEEANQILNQSIPETLEIEDGESYAQPRCPKCQSFDVSYRELNKFISYGSAYAGIPIPVHKKAWTCHACRHEWEETEAGDQAEDSTVTS
jgi:hypothetical protein